jgi:hypothetical protein
MKFKVDLKPPAMTLMKMSATIATFNDLYDQCRAPYIITLFNLSKLKSIIIKIQVLLSLIP